MKNETEMKAKVKTGYLNKTLFLKLLDLSFTDSSML